MDDPVVIVGASRTPMGGMQGAFDGIPAAELGGAAIRGALEAAGVAASDVDELMMGCVLPAGQGQAPARQAGFLAGLGQEVPASTLNKMCGSGMKTAMIAHDQVALGNGKVVVAGGMESMSNAPYMLPKMRGGARLGHATAQDHMFLDGLEDAYDKGRLMGTFAEDCAEKYQFTREAQDAYALASLDRAIKATDSGVMAREITPFTVKTRKGETLVEHDEQLATARPDKIPNLKPAFREGGNGDSGQRLVDLRWGRSTGLHARKRGQGAGSDDPCPGAGPFLACARATMVLDSTRPGDQQAAGAFGADEIRYRPVGDQRGLRRCPHGRDGRDRDRA